MSLYVITMNGCPGCEKYKKNIHPTLSEKLKGMVKYTVVEKSETNLLPEKIRSINKTWYPMLIYEDSKGNLHVFNGIIVNGETKIQNKYKWDTQEILKWLCNSSMDGTSIICQFNGDGSVKMLINNPLISLI